MDSKPRKSILLRTKFVSGYSPFWKTPCTVKLLTRRDLLQITLFCCGDKRNFIDQCCTLSGQDLIMWATPSISHRWIPISEGEFKEGFLGIGIRLLTDKKAFDLLPNPDTEEKCEQEVAPREQPLSAEEAYLMSVRGQAQAKTGKKTSKRSLLASMTAEERYHLQQQEQQQQRGRLKERSQTVVGNSNNGAFGDELSMKPRQRLAQKQEETMRAHMTDEERYLASKAQSKASPTFDRSAFASRDPSQPASSLTNSGSNLPKKESVFKGNGSAERLSPSAHAMGGGRPLSWGSRDKSARNSLDVGSFSQAGSGSSNSNTNNGSPLHLAGAFYSSSDSASGDQRDALNMNAYTTSGSREEKATTLNAQGPQSPKRPSGSMLISSGSTPRDGGRELQQQKERDREREAREDSVRSPRERALNITTIDRGMRSASPAPTRVRTDRGQEERRGEYGYGADSSFADRERDRAERERDLQEQQQMSPRKPSFIPGLRSDKLNLAAQTGLDAPLHELSPRSRNASASQIGQSAERERLAQAARDANANARPDSARTGRGPLNVTVMQHVRSKQEQPDLPDEPQHSPRHDPSLPMPRREDGMETKQQKLERLQIFAKDPGNGRDTSSSSSRAEDDVTPDEDTNRSLHRVGRIQRSHTGASKRAGNDERESPPNTNPTPSPYASPTQPSNHANLQSLSSSSPSTMVSGNKSRLGDSGESLSTPSARDNMTQLSNVPSLPAPKTLSPRTATKDLNLKPAENNNNRQPQTQQQPGAVDALRSPRTSLSRTMSVGGVTPPSGLARSAHGQPGVMRAGSTNQPGGRDSGSWTKSTGPYANSSVSGNSSQNGSAADSPEPENSPRQAPINRFTRAGAPNSTTPSPTAGNNTAAKPSTPPTKSEPPPLTPEQIANDHWPGWDDAHVTELPFPDSDDSEDEESDSLEETEEDADASGGARAAQQDEWPNWNDCHPDEIAVYRQAKKPKERVEEWRDWDGEES